MRRTLVVIGIVLVAAVILAAQGPLNLWLQQALLQASGAIERAWPRAGTLSEPPPELEIAPQPLWTFPPNVIPPNWRPLIDPAGRVFVATWTDLVVIDSRGEELRRTRILDAEGNAFAGAARHLVDGRVVLPVHGGFVVFAPDGSRTSTIPLTSASERPRAPVEAADGSLVTVIVESNATGSRRLLLALDPAHGAERWRFDAEQNRIDWIMPADNDRLYVSISGTRWEFDRKGHRTAALGAYRVVDRPLLIAGTGELLHLPSIDWPVPPTLAQSGVTRGAAPCKPMHVTLDRDGRTAYHACDRTSYATIHAVSVDGTERWSRDVKWIAPYPLTPAPDGGIYAVVDYGLQAFAADGTSRFRMSLSKKVSHPGTPTRVMPVQITTPPRIAPDGTIFVGTDSGVYAITPDGQIRWRYGSAEREGSPPYVTHLDFLDGALLVRMAGLIALPVPSARLQPAMGEEYYAVRD